MPALTASTSLEAAESPARAFVAAVTAALVGVAALVATGVATATPTVQAVVSPPLVSSTGPNVNFSADESGTYAIRLEALAPCSGTILSQGAYVTPGVTSVPILIGSLAEGANTIGVCLTLTTGRGSLTAVVTKDTMAPGPPSITQQPPSTTASPTATIAFTHVEPGASFRCSLDLAAPAACRSPAVLSGLGDGSHTFTTHAVDAAGNEGSAAALVVSWLVDTSNPQTLLDGAPAPDTSTTSATFSFSSPVAGALF